MIKNTRSYKNRTSTQVTHLIKLTERETTCLYLAGLGKTTKETAIILKIAPSTVENYRKRIKEKLYCKTITEAVYKGIGDGHLSANKTIDFLTTDDNGNDEA
jgi:DNA-binding CsgD family transcriptional regulator